MIKVLVFAVLSFLGLLPSHASRSSVQIRITGPCDQKPMLIKQLKVGESDTVYSLTKRILHEARIQYHDDGKGFAQINLSPIGDQALVVFGENNESMRAYGWCFHVNSQMPLIYANEIPIGPNIHLIDWFYAYSEMYKNQWLNMCIPSFQLKEDQICKK